MKNKIFKYLLCLLLLIALPLVSFACSPKRLSAYDIAVQNGFEGTEQEWLNSLKGKSAYEIAVQNGFEGTEQEWLASLTTTMEDDIVCASEKCLNQVVEVYIGSTPASAVVYSIDKTSGTAYFITCCHVAFGSSGQERTNLTAKIDDQMVPLAVVDGRSSVDIAILKVENSDVVRNCNLSAVSFAQSVSVGETCIAIGNPKGIGLTCTTGVIGQLSSLQDFTVVGTTQHIMVNVHSASTTTGNSGGGLFNTKGELIGITNGGKATSAEDSFLIKYAIPIDSVLSVIDSTI